MTTQSSSTQPRATRARFATRFGVIATTVGSAVGLGNIWRFPYEVGTHGGGAFLMCYVFFIFVLGIPVICAEFAAGRHTRSNVFGATRILSAGRGHWHWIGYIGLASSLMILSFYSVVAGWTLEYLWQSVSGALTGAADGSYHAKFDALSTGVVRPLVWTWIFLLINYLVLRRGVRKGVERISNILMPLLFVLLVVFCINSLLMPEAPRGLRFLFEPDFDKLTPGVVLGALGQAFFSLSLGLGCMLTYASYFGDNANIVRSATITALLDTLVAVLAGVIIFPAVFTYGATPGEGPTLVFEVLPEIFRRMPCGIVWSSLFFLMLFVASLTSTISMSEISISTLTDHTRLSRKAASTVNLAVALVFGTLCTLSFSGLSDIRIMGRTFSWFGFFNDFSSNVLLPVGGVGISLLMGWVVDRRLLADELTNGGRLRHVPVGLIRTALRYVAPVAIGIILLMSVGLL